MWLTYHGYTIPLVDVLKVRLDFMEGCEKILEENGYSSAHF